MTKAEFVARFTHELSGRILEGATAQRTGADLGLYCRTICKWSDAKLAEMYDALTVIERPPPAVAGTTNGRARQPAGAA